MGRLNNIFDKFHFIIFIIRNVCAKCGILLPETDEIRDTLG